MTHTYESKNKERYNQYCTDLWSLSLLKVDNDWKVKRWEEAIVDDGIILPPVDSTGNVIVRFLFQSSPLYQIQFWALEIVKLKTIIFKDTADATSLDPQ